MANDAASADTKNRAPSARKLVELLLVVCTPHNSDNCSRNGSGRETVPPKVVTISCQHQSEAVTSNQWRWTLPPRKRERERVHQNSGLEPDNRTVHTFILRVFGRTDQAGHLWWVVLKPFPLFREEEVGPG